MYPLVHFLRPKQGALQTQMSDLAAKAATARNKGYTRVSRTDEGEDPTAFDSTDSFDGAGAGGVQRVKASPRAQRRGTHSSFEFESLVKVEGRLVVLGSCCCRCLLLLFPQARKPTGGLSRAHNALLLSGTAL